MATNSDLTSVVSAAGVIKQNDSRLSACQEEKLLQSYRLPPHSNYASEATELTYIRIGNDEEGQLIPVPNKVTLPEREDWAKDLKPRA